MNTEITDTPVGWIFYDADCEFCIGWVARFYPLLRPRGFRFAPLQADWVRERLQNRGIDSTTIQEMRLLLGDGLCYGGGDAVIRLARELWWAWPLSWIGSFAPGRFLIGRVYRWIAVNRHCLKGSCAARPGRKLQDPGHSAAAGFYDFP